MPEARLQRTREAYRDDSPWSYRIDPPIWPTSKDLYRRAHTYWPIPPWRPSCADLEDSGDATR